MRAWVEVRLDLLRENAVAALRAAGGDAGLVPMVKAEAYGLGMKEVVAALRELPAPGQPWAFGVAAVAEGERLRSHGWDGRILVFSPVSPGDYQAAVRARLTLCLSEVAAVERLAAAAREAGLVLPFHLEIDTGMGRAGLDWRTAAEWGHRIASIASGVLRWEGSYTHFHSADEPDLGPADEQWERFGQALDRLPGITPRPLVHAANSGATLRRGGYGGDLVRPGIFLYGGRAGPGAEPAPVVSVRARVVLVKDVPAGSTAGYGATYRASGPERWATLSIGYGDGIARALAAGGGEVIVHGRRVPIIGRISMDMITIDVTSIAGVAVGDIATVIGADGDEWIGIDEVAERCGTISYEVLTRLGSRLPRVYLEREPGDALQG